MLAWQRISKRGTLANGRIPSLRGEGAYDMLSYGFSIKGKAHIKTGVVCQDANMHGRLLPDCISVLLQMGVGSARHSDIASGLATEKHVKYLENHIQSDYSVEEKMHVSRRDTAMRRRQSRSMSKTVMIC